MKKYENFRVWFQKTLPTLYNDALTYSELLYKIVVDFNNLIDNFNELIDEVNKFYEDTNTAINEWKAYILQQFTNFQNDVNKRIKDFEDLTNQNIDEFKNLVSNAIDKFTTDINNQFEQFTSQMNTNFDDFKTNTNTIVNDFKSSVTQQLADFSTEFSELKTYVDNYFANLNITTEIENIIDSMVADGSFENIIVKYINEELLRAYLNRNELEALADIPLNAFALVGTDHVEQDTESFFQAVDANGVISQDSHNLFSLASNPGVYMKRIPKHLSNVMDNVMPTYGYLCAIGDNFLVSTGWINTFIDKFKFEDKLIHSDPQAKFNEPDDVGNSTMWQNINSTLIQISEDLKPYVYTVMLFAGAKNINNTGINMNITTDILKCCNFIHNQLPNATIYFGFTSDKQFDSAALAKINEIILLVSRLPFVKCYQNLHTQLLGLPNKSIYNNENLKQYYANYIASLFLGHEEVLPYDVGLLSMDSHITVTSAPYCTMKNGILKIDARNYTSSKSKPASNVEIGVLRGHQKPYSLTARNILNPIVPVAQVSALINKLGIVSGTTLVWYPGENTYQTKSTTSEQYTCLCPDIYISMMDMS